MNNINNAIVLSLVSFILIIFAMNYSERFTDMINLTNLTKPITNNSEFVTDDLSKLEVEEVLPNEVQFQVEELVDQILERFNKDYNKKLIRISIERVEKNVTDDTTDFQVWVFVFNYKKESNAKVLIDFTLDKNDFVRVNKVNILGSRQSILTSRGGVSGRDIENLKKPVDMDKVDGLLLSPMDFSNFNVSETSNKMVDRNSWIIHKVREDIGNVKTFPARKVHNEWDINGVKIVDKMVKGSPGGINYGNRNFTLVPHFMKNNFESCFGDYLWLFDKAADVVSKPIGVG
jgi:hypothetical protein